MNYYPNTYTPYPTYPQMQNTAYGSNFQPTQPMKTNKIYVTSLEDALSRYSEPNSIMVYRLQDESREFEVTTDAQGKKNYKTIEFANFNATMTDTEKDGAYISLDEYNALNRRITALENKIKSKAKNEVTENE